MSDIGLGCSEFNFAVYIANQPNMAEFQNIDKIIALNKGEIYAIGQVCGNGWRKVFNVYAKLLYALEETTFPYKNLSHSWQEFRNDYLLQAKTKLALIFTPPQLNFKQSTIHIICGRSYAKELLAQRLITTNLIWLDHEFAIDRQQNLIVCPYFDYRQLSNIKIERLALLIHELTLKST